MTAKIEMIIYSDVCVLLWILFFISIIYLCIFDIPRLFLLDRKI